MHITPSTQHAGISSANGPSNLFQQHKGESNYEFNSLPNT
jgi:hypothetical protein